MTKAKELAREVISQMEEIQRQVMNNNILSGFTNDWQSGFNHAMIELRNRLNDAVLSEPDESCRLKGWIEVHAILWYDKVESLHPRLVNINNVDLICEEADKNSTRIAFASGPESSIVVKESYDEIKQKIKEAS